jgi:hypothetical protein
MKFDIEEVDMGKVLFLTSAILSILWGSAHLIPTKSIVTGFGDISKDNEQIITMEWIIEGVSLIFIGILIAAVTLLDSTAPVSILVYFLSADVLVVLAVVSLFTGFKVSYLPFKLCPVIFGISAALIFLGVTV